MDKKLEGLLTEFYSCQHALFNGLADNIELREALNAYLKKLYNALDDAGVIIEPTKDESELLPQERKMYQVRGYEEDKFQLQSGHIWLGLFMQRAL